MDSHEDDKVTSQGRLDNSMEQLVAEGLQRKHGDRLDLKDFPNISFYYKMVARWAAAATPSTMARLSTLWVNI